MRKKREDPWRVARGGGPSIICQPEGRGKEGTLRGEKKENEQEGTLLAGEVSGSDWTNRREGKIS